MRVLIADPSPNTARSVASTVGELGHDARIVTDGQSTWALLAPDGAIDVAFMSSRLAGPSTPEVLRQLRSRERRKPTWCVLVPHTHAEVEAGLRAGADDVMWSSPPDPIEVAARLALAQRGIRVLRSVDTLQEALKSQSLVDPTSGLPNRRAVVDLLQRELARSSRQSTPLTVVHADIDGFRYVNDRFGHEVGDVILREVARRVRSSIRGYDAVCRSGPDELVVVLPGCGHVDGERLAGRIREVVGAEGINTGTARIGISVAVGWTTILGPLEPSTPTSNRAEGPIDASDVLRTVEAATQQARAGAKVVFGDVRSSRG